MAHFDAWAANFAEAVTALELAPDGSGYRMHTRFAKFINLPELLSMFRTFADVQTADMLNLPCAPPNGDLHDIVHRDYLLQHDFMPPVVSEIVLVDLRDYKALVIEAGT